MKQKITLLLCILISVPLSGQNRYDNNWVFANLSLGGKLLNFDNNTLHINPISLTEGRSREALVSMSDKEGNLIFYSNNCSIFDKNHALMENGEGLNPGQIQTYWCSVNPFANPNGNSIFSIPDPGNNSNYYIFHRDFEAFNIGLPGGSQFAPLHFYCSKINISQNNGLGKVTSKNEVIIADTLSSNGMQAVRHANGRDWWILIPEFKGNCYYRVILSPNGIEVIDKQCIGKDWDKYAQSGGAYFTPDGTKYVRCHAEYGLNIFDFDRCSGKLSNPTHIGLEAPDTYLISSMALSANGRFVYYNTRSQIFQFDIDALDIAASKVLVAQFDGFQSAGNNTDFYYSRLAPDGKIYICTYNQTYYLHTIEHPDSVGLACKVMQHSTQLPFTHFASMPNYPNYRLGALPGPCDTINTSATELETAQTALSITPNPSTGDFQVKSTENEVLTRIEIIDLAGKIVHAFQCDNTLVTLRREQHQLGRGFYLIRATGKRGHQYVSKIILE